MSHSTDSSEHFIVVGVDGSEASKGALRWALRQAQLTGSSLQAVMSWSMPVMAYGVALPMPDGLDLEGDSHHVVDAVVADVIGDGSGIKVSTTVVEGHPAEKLLEAAKGADLLVVGSRGHGSFAGMLLGSVSAHCVAHARCPVVVIHDLDQPSAETA